MGARNTELLKGTLEYDNEAPMNTSEVGWNRDNYSSLCLLIGMGTFACSSLRLTQSVRADVEQQGDQRERCNRIKKQTVNTKRKNSNVYSKAQLAQRRQSR